MKTSETPVSNKPPVMPSSRNTRVGRWSPKTMPDSKEAARTVIIRQLDDNDLEARALGRSDYPTELPLREVLLIARHCSGAIILGFEQFRASGGLKKRGTPTEEQVSTPIPFPTPWNHLRRREARGRRNENRDFHLQ